MKEQHNPDFQGFACDIPNCNRSYNRRNDLVRHKAKHHPDSEATTQQPLVRVPMRLLPTPFIY